MQRRTPTPDEILRMPWHARERYLKSLAGPIHDDDPDEATEPATVARRGPEPTWSIAEARRLINRGWTHQEVADEFHIRRATLRRRLHRDNARQRARSAA
jgi:hypothetical protein